MAPNTNIHIDPSIDTNLNFTSDFDWSSIWRSGRDRVTQDETTTRHDNDNQIGPNVPVWNAPSWSSHTQEYIQNSSPSASSSFVSPSYNFDYDSWLREQQAAAAAAAAAAKKAKDVESRRRDERNRLEKLRDKANPLVESVTPVGMGYGVTGDTNDMIRQTVDAVTSTDNVSGYHQDATQEAEVSELLRPFVQESVNALGNDSDAVVDSDEVEYENDKQERVKKADYDSATDNAMRSQNARAVAVQRDNARMVPVAYRDHNENNSPDSKPSAFKTLVADTIGRSTRSFRNILSNRRSSSQKKYVENRFLSNFKSRMRGNGFFAQMVQAPNRDLGLHQIGVGWREVVALVEQAPQVFEQLLRDSGCVFDTIIPEPGERVDIDKIRTIVKTAENGVWVAVTKSPEVDILDIERMQLVILDDMERGLAFHPIIAPMFNADFDGDQAFVFFNKWIADHSNTVMDYIVNWEGRTNLSGDWIPSVSLAKGTDVEKYVREKIFWQFGNMGFKIDGIVKAMANILENELSDDKMSMWVDLFRAARHMAGDDDIVMSRVIRTAYDFVRTQANDNLLHIAGRPIESNNFTQPKTDEDWRLFDVMEYYMEAELPNNWQAFRRLFHSFPGNIKGKNPPFRFTGDVGRSFAIDDRIRTEMKRLHNEDGDYYEVATDDQWKIFHKMTAKYIASRKMAVEKEKDERWQASRDAFRSRVVRRMAYLSNPDSMDLYAKDVDLRSGYPDPKRGLDFDFIELFTRAYNIEVSNANQANAQFADRFGHVEWGEQSLIEVDSNGFPVDPASLAEPLLSVYPDLTIDNAFVFIEDRTSDPRWIGNPNHIDSTDLHSYENESGVIGERSRNLKTKYWMMKSRYSGYSLLQFSRRNNIIWSQSRTTDSDASKRSTSTKRESGGTGKVTASVHTKYSDIKGSNSNAMLQYCLMLAIADKRTSAASTFQMGLIGNPYDKTTRQITHRGWFKRGYDPTNAKYRRAGAEIRYVSVEGKDEDVRLDTPYRKSAFDKFSDLLCELVDLDKEGIEDRALEIEAISFVVTELFPDMAHYFDMDTIEGFAESGYGRILMEHARWAMDRKTRLNGDSHKLVDYVASTWLSMVFDYEMDDVYRKSSILSTAETAEEISESTNALEFAWKKLANKSEVWEGIVKEIESGHEAWTELQRIAREDTDRAKELRHLDYWRNPRHNDIIEVIQDTNLLFGEKVDIITDVVRYQTNNPWINTFEIPYGMRIADNQLYSINSANRKSAMGDITNFSDAYSSYAKTSRATMHQEVKKAADRWNTVAGRGRLLRAIRNLDRMPWLARRISDAHYSSAVVAILDKTTHQLEKGSQADEPNFIYQSMTMEHTDGAYSDLYQTDSRVLGIVSTKNIGLSDFLSILADPNKVVTIYNRRGAMCQVNASALLFGDLNHDLSDEAEYEKALWKFLLDNPRIATMLRRHEVCSGAKGNAWLGVSKNGSIGEMIEFMSNENIDHVYNPIDHAKYLTEIHPGLASLLVLCDPIGNRTSRMYQPSFERTKNHLIYRMCEEARRARGRKVGQKVLKEDVSSAASDLLEEFGVTEDNMIRSNRPDYLERSDNLGLVKTDAAGLSVDENVANDQEAIDEAISLYEIACDYAAEYIAEIANEVDFSTFPGMDGYEAPEDLGSRGIGRESFLAFIDINQELGASKTSMSTGVNGMTTFDHVEWVRFIDAQDQYVDLEWVMTCTETDLEYPLQFNGSLTSVMDGSGNFIPFEAAVDENGNVVTNYDTLRELAGEDEIVIAGNGARLRDRSTRKDGRVMPALFKQMDSKRSKASEKLNLKLKKFGLDVLDSIIKMGSKYRDDMSYSELRRTLNDLYEENGHSLMATHLMLGQQLYNAAVELGYDDLSLSDFTCIASLMVIVGEDGNVYVRSIEQLSNAIRYATSRLDHEPSFEEMQEFVNRIVNDNTISSGVGIMTFDAHEAFDEWQPAKTASSVLPTRHVSSNETRNHAMLDTIEKDQYNPSEPDFTEADARELSRQILVYEKKTKAKKPVFGEPKLRDVFGRCQMAQDYIPIGGVGARSSTSVIGSDNTRAYGIAERFHNIPRNAIGPRYAYIIGDGNCSQSEIDRAVEMCYKRGLTMIVSWRHVEKLGNCKTIGKMSLANSLLADAMEASDSGDVIIPFFDMRLNGSEAMPIQGQGSMFTVSSYEGEYFASYESRSKEQGDAATKATRHFANRIHLVEEADMTASDDSLFRITYMNSIFDRCRKTVREATPEEVEEFIINSGRFPIMDLGVNNSDSADVQQYLDDVVWGIERYRNRWIALDGNVTDTVSTDLRPGDIVSWQVCDITDPDGNISHVFAPVIPFQLHGSVSVPPVYSITGMTHENGMISVSWRNESSAPGNTIKSVDPMSGASKGVAYVPTDEYLDIDENGIFDDDRLVLKTGTMIDLSMEEAATSSRKEGTDKRLKTLVTLMIELRKLGFNYGNVEGAFPGRPDLAERLGLGSYSSEVREDEDGNQVEVETGRITKEEWRELLSDPDFRFHETDPRINRLLRVECSKFMDAGWNPSDFMSNLLDYNDGNGIRNSGRMWEFETTLDPRLDYENDLLHFFHTINDRFCPDGIDDMGEETDSGERYYFRMWRDDLTGRSEGYDKGQVQMEIPVKDSSGQWYDLWHNVYVGRGFLAKQTSMLGRPNVSTSTFNPSAAHAMAYTHYGISFGRRLESNMLNWALSNVRSNWSKRGGILDETAPTARAGEATQSEETHVPNDAGASNATSSGFAGVPDVDADTIGNEANVTEDVTSVSPTPTQDRNGLGLPARDMSSLKRFFGNYSPIIDAAYRQAEIEQRTRSARDAQGSRVVDEGKVSEARKNFVSSNYVNESVVDYLGVTPEEFEFYKDVATDQLESQLGITEEDTAAYIDDYPMILGSLEDYLAEVGVDPSDIEDAKKRFARIGAHKKKYGDMSSIGRGAYDIDFDNYDFTGKPVVSPIAMDVINGNTSEAVRNNYIFEVEKRVAEDEGRLDEWLAYWSGESLRDQLDRQINGYDDLAEYLSRLRGNGVRTTISDVMKTENDARIGRRVQRKAELAYRKDSIAGIRDGLRTYQYTVSYTMPDGPLDALSKIRDDLAAVIEVAKVEDDDFFPGNPNGNYGLLLELRNKCDARVQFALRYSTNRGDSNIRAMEDLAKIRELVKDGKLDGKTDAKKDLVDVIRSIDATVVEIDALKHEANKLLHRDMIEDETQRVRSEFAQASRERRAEEERSKRQEETEEIRSSGDWNRTNVRKGFKRKEDWNIRRRVERATAARLERSQQRLRNALLNDDTSDLEKEYARMGLAFIETIVNPLKIKVAGFDVERRTRTVNASNGKQKTITESRPSWGAETDRLLEKAQFYVGSSGGKLRVASIAMCRMALGIASDGTISHINAEDFEVSERQFREVIKDIIAYCQRGMSPTGLSDNVRGNPNLNRDSSGEFVVIAGTKRYPTFMPFDLWLEMCSDPTSKFYVEGRNPRDVAKERFKDDVESWRQNVHNAVAAEGDIDQLIAIDNIARAVISMSDDVTDISLPEIKMAFDLETITADAMRSDDPDIYVPLEFMRQKITEAAVRESRRDKYHAWNDGRIRGFIRGRNRLRKGSGSASIPIMLSSPFEEGENIVKGTMANALSNYAAMSSELMGDQDTRTRFDYGDSRYKAITTSRQWSENYRVLVALYRIGDWDLIGRYLDEKDRKTGRYVNDKFTESELNSFLIRNGYIKAPNTGKGVIDRASNVTREAMAMAERIMTDFATSEGLPGLDVQEARLFAKNCMTDARVLENDLYRRSEHDRIFEERTGIEISPLDFAYSVDTADAIATAETMGTGALMRKMISTQSGREAFMSMGFYGAGRKNPFTSLMNRVMWDHGIVETVISMCINSYPCYGIGKSLALNPISSTASYLAVCGYAGIGDILVRAGESRDIKALAKIGDVMGRAADNQMGTRSAALTIDENGNIRQRRFSLVGLRKNIIYDMITAGSTVGKIIVTMSIIQSMGGIAPPDDPENRLNYEEWKIGGENGIPFKLAWWLDDLTGISIPCAVGLLVNEGVWDFKDEDGNVVLTLTGNEMSSKIMENGIASMNDGTFVFEAIDLFTHWDEHWRTALDMDALDNIGNRDGIVAPKSKEDWYVTTTRNLLLDQFGQMAPAFIDELVPTSQDCVYAGERYQTSPYLQWDTKDGTISLEEAQRKGIVTGIDDWHEVSLREVTRKYWVLGQMMNVMNWGLNLTGAGSTTGYTWAEMPDRERADQYTYAMWKDYSFDFKDIPKDDIEGFLTAQGQNAYKQILENYDSAEDAIADGFYLSHDALANARAYCKSKMEQLSSARNIALNDLNSGPFRNDYYEVKEVINQEIQRQYDEAKKVNDILWDQDFPSSVPKYKQQTSSYSTRYVDSEGNPSTYIQYLLGNATKERYAYGDMPNPLAFWTRPRQQDKLWNSESPTWNMIGNDEVDHATAKKMHHDIVDNNLTYEHRDGTIEDLSDTYFGGTRSPKGLMLSAEDLPTTGTRIDVAEQDSLPSYMRTQADLEDYYKKATGLDYDGLDTSIDLPIDTTDTSSQGTDNGSTSGQSTSGLTGILEVDEILKKYGIVNEDGSMHDSDDNGGYHSYYYNGGRSYYGGSRSYYSGGSYSYSYGGSGGSSYNPKIYSTSRNVSARSASGMSTRSPYKASSSYLRPTFYTSGSHKSYLRSS